MAAYTSSQTGAWDNVDTWGGGGYPQNSGDTATIGHAVTAASGNINIGTSGTITINSSGSLVWGSTTMTCGAIACNGTAILTTGSGAWTCQGLNGTTGSCTGTLTIGTGGITVSAAAMTWKGGGDVVINGNVVSPGIGGVDTSIALGSASADVTIASGVAFTSPNSNTDRYYLYGNVTAGAGASFGGSGSNYPYMINFGQSDTLLSLVGTSGSHITIRPGQGGVGFSGDDVIHLQWVDIVAQSTAFNAGFASTNDYPNNVLVEDCYFNGCGVTVSDTSTIHLRRCIQGGATNGVSGRSSRVKLFDVAFGRDNTGAADANSGADIQSGTASYTPLSLVGKSVYCGSTTQLQWNNVANDEAGFIAIDNWGFVNRSGGSWPAMTRGVGIFSTPAGEAVRSTSAAKSGSYGLRMTPFAAGDWPGAPWFRAKVRIAVPIQSGDNISVTVYCRRGASTTLDTAAAEMELDPDNVWFTPDSDASAFSGNDWDQLSVSGSTAAGSSNSGMVEIELRVVDYVAAQYVDWADMEITCGGKSYTVGMINFQGGQPALDEPTGAVTIIQRPRRVI